MRKLKTLAVIATMSVLVVPLSVGAQSPTPPQTLVQALLGQIEVAANQNGVNANDILQAKLKLQPSDGSDPVNTTVQEAIVRIAGTSLIDSTQFHGVLGTPQANVGDILHVFIDFGIEEYPKGLNTAQFLDLGAPDRASYTVLESGLTPDTPILAVPNPLVLTGQELPPEVPAGLAAPLLFTHLGGRLKSIQASGYDFGASITIPTSSGPLTVTGGHTAGTAVLGSNADTEARPTAEGDPWPIWLPLLTGALARPDSAIDFLGFGAVILSLEVPCFPTVGLVDHDGLPNTPPVLRIIRRTCISIGSMVGDGASLFDGAPADLRQVTSAVGLWNPVPEPVATVVTAVDGVLGEVGGVLEQVQIPEVPTQSLQQSSSKKSGLSRLLRK